MTQVLMAKKSFKCSAGEAPYRAKRPRKCAYAHLRPLKSACARLFGKKYLCEMQRPIGLMGQIWRASSDSRARTALYRFAPERSLCERKSSAGLGIKNGRFRRRSWTLKQKMFFCEQWQISNQDALRGRGRESGLASGPPPHVGGYGKWRTEIEGEKPRNAA